MWALIKACDAFQLCFRINSYNNFSMLEIYLLSSRVPGLYGNTSLRVSITWGQIGASQLFIRIIQNHISVLLSIYSFSP